MTTYTTMLIVGRLGSDPKLFGKDNKAASLSVCVNYRVKRESGDWEDKPEWHSVKVISESLVKYASSNFKAGDLVLVQGTPRQTEYKRKADDVLVQGIELVVGFGGAVQLVQRKNARPGEIADVPDELELLEVPT